MQTSLPDTHRAAPQQAHGTVRGANPPSLRADRPAWSAAPVRTDATTRLGPRAVFIQGVALDGQTFRPSDWAERLAGAMSCFRPGGMHGGIGAYIGYSPLCVPRTIDGVKCVIVSETLRDIEPMAWDFVMNFARDNQLQTAEAFLLAEPTIATAALTA